jgi:hypothetical protein
MRPGFVLQVKKGDVRAIALAMSVKFPVKYRFVPYAFEKEILIRSIREFSEAQGEKTDDFYALATDIHNEMKKELGEVYMDRDAKRKYYSGYETAKADKAKGRVTKSRPSDNQHWARGYQDFMGGKTSDVQSPLEFLESHEGFHEGDRVSWTVGDQYATGTVVDHGWLTIRVKLDHDVRHLQTGAVVKGGSIISVADRNLSLIGESGMSKGQFWAKKGKTPWGTKAGKAEGEDYASCSNCGEHVKKGEKVCPNCGEKAPSRLGEKNVFVTEGDIIQFPGSKTGVQWSPAPPEQMDRAHDVMKAAIHVCLGKVFHYTGGTRRYVCASVHCYGIQGDNQDYIIDMDLMALSGSDKACNPTGNTTKDVGSKWLLDKDQTITFKGKMASKLAAMYKYKATKPLKPEIVSGTAIGSHMTFNVGAAAAGVAPASPTVTQEAVYSRLDKGCITEMADTGALRRIQDLKALSVGSPDWEMLVRALHDDLRSGMLSKDMVIRVRDVLGAADNKLATRPDFEEVMEDRLTQALKKGEVLERKTE